MSAPGCSPRPATKASRQPGCTPRAPGPPPAPGQREARTGPWETGRERGAPWRRGLCPSAPGRRRRRRGPASLHLQTPAAQPPPERRLLRPPAPRSASPSSSPRPLLRSDPPFSTPNRPPQQPGRTRAPRAPTRAPRSLPAAAPAAPSRRQAGVRGRRAARVGRAAAAARTVPLRVPPPPPAPRGARAPGDAMEPPRSERHKGVRGTMGAASSWAPGARSAARPCTGVGAPAAAAAGRAPAAPLRVPSPAPAPTPAWMLQPLSPPVRRPRAAAAARPARSAPRLPGTRVLYFAERVRAELGATWGGAGSAGPGSGGRARRAWPGRPGEQSLGAASGRRVFSPLCVCPCAALSRDVTGLRVSFPHKDTGAPAALEPQPLRPHPRPAPPPQRGTRGTGGGGGARA